MTLQVAPDPALAPLTTLEIGGPAAQLIHLTDPADFPDLVDLARRQDTVPRVIGHGSNILVADSGFDGLVVHMMTTGFTTRPRPDGRVEVTVQAGHELQTLVQEMIEAGLGGMEMMTGVPGTVGATPIQNVGAYGQEVQDTITMVRAYDWDTRQMMDLTNHQCGFGHRTSMFKHQTRHTIVQVTFALTPTATSAPIIYPGVARAAGVPLGQRTSLAAAAAAVRDVRGKKGMLMDRCDRDHRNVGSVFMSPVIPEEMARTLRADGAPVNSFPDGATRVSASHLMRMAGYALGQTITPGVRISGHHHTIVADDGATAERFAHGSALVARRVLETTGIMLTAEPDLIGELPAYTALTAQGRCQEHA